MSQQFTSLLDLTPSETLALLRLSAPVKSSPSEYKESLAGRTMAMIFEKSSTRTRVSFEAGIHQLGGHAVFLSNSDSQVGRGEAYSDTAGVLSRYVDLILARTQLHSTILELAHFATVPVINALSDELHPCQALADALTLQEQFGDLAGRTVAWVGDGNNVAHSFALICVRLGLHVRVATPVGYEMSAEFSDVIAKEAALAGVTFEAMTDPVAAVAGASAVSTDVWTSMGQEAENEKRLKDFQGYQVDSTLMAAATDDSIFLHCLPCHRGEEVTAEVVDGSRSVIFDQAENRLHTQKALMLFLLRAEILDSVKVESCST